MEEFNDQRLSGGRPLLIPLEQSYGHPRFNAFVKSKPYQEFRSRAQHLSGAGSGPQPSLVANEESKNADIEMESEDTTGLVKKDHAGLAQLDVAMEEGLKSKGE